MEVRSVIQRIAVEHRRRYGYRRITAELRRRGMLVNHKRVLGILRADNLLGVQPRRFVVTTDSDHRFEVYLNLASRMRLTGINQLLGRGHHLHPIAPRVCLPGGGAGCVFTQGGGMGAGPYAGGAVADHGAAAGHGPTTTAAGLGASLGSRRAVRVRRLRSGPATVPNDSEHEPSREPVRQRQLRKFHEDVETRRNLRERVPQFGPSFREYRSIHRTVLQSVPVTFGIGLPTAGGVRAGCQSSDQFCWSDNEFFQAWGDLSVR
jgi:hypothetical protein